MMHHRMSVDVSAKEIADLKLEQNVRVVVEGKITELRAGEPEHKSKKNEPGYPMSSPSIYVDVAKVTVTPSDNEFAKMAEDEDEADES